MMHPTQAQRKTARGKAAIRKRCQQATKAAARQARRTMGASFNTKAEAS